MEAIMVNRSDSGAYEIPGSASVEDWAEIRAAADDVDHVERLLGWDWTECWQVKRGDATSYYFVRP